MQGVDKSRKVAPLCLCLSLFAPTPLSLALSLSVSPSISKDPVCDSVQHGDIPNYGRSLHAKYSFESSEGEGVSVHCA